MEVNREDLQELIAKLEQIDDQIETYCNEWQTTLLEAIHMLKSI